MCYPEAMAEKSNTNKKVIAERSGMIALKTRVEELEKDLADIKRRLPWPEIIPMDDEASEIFALGMEDVYAGRVTPAFSSSKEFQEYRKNKRTVRHV